MRNNNKILDFLKSTSLEFIKILKLSVAIFLLSYFLIKPRQSLELASQNFLILHIKMYLIFLGAYIINEGVKYIGLKEMPEFLKIIFAITSEFIRAVTPIFLLIYIMPYTLIPNIKNNLTLKDMFKSLGIIYGLILIVYLVYFYYRKYKEKNKS